MQLAKMSLLTALATICLQQVCHAEPTPGEQEAQEAAWEAFADCRDALAYARDSNFKTQATIYSRSAYQYAIYTNYGYNIRRGEWAPLSAYDRMWVWAQIAEDADLAYRWFVAGWERGYIPRNSSSSRAIFSLWESMVAAEAAADEAFDDWWNSFSW